MLAVGCCSWDDDEGLNRLIESCYKHVDVFFNIAGQFHDYPDNGKHGVTCNICPSKYPNVVCYHVTDFPEHVQRQIYLDLCGRNNIDFLIIADTDEYFHDCDWEAFKEERERVCNSDFVYNIKNYTEIGGLLLPLDQPRLIKNPSMVHYLNGHHYQIAVNGTDEAITAKDTLYSIKLCHDPSIRSPERKEKHDKYIRWLKRYEAGRMMIETPKEKENRLASVWAGA